MGCGASKTVEVAKELAAETAAQVKEQAHKVAVAASDAAAAAHGKVDEAKYKLVGCEFAAECESAKSQLVPAKTALKAFEDHFNAWEKGSKPMKVNVLRRFLKECYTGEGKAELEAMTAKISAIAAHHVSYKAKTRDEVIKPIEEAKAAVEKALTAHKLYQDSHYNLKYAIYTKKDKLEEAEKNTLEAAEQKAKEECLATYKSAEEVIKTSVPIALANMKKVVTAFAAEAMNLESGGEELGEEEDTSKEDALAYDRARLGNLKMSDLKKAAASKFEAAKRSYAHIKLNEHYLNTRKEVSNTESHVSASCHTVKTWATSKVDEFLAPKDLAKAKDLGPLTALCGGSVFGAELAAYEDFLLKVQSKSDELKDLLKAVVDEDLTKFLNENVEEVNHLAREYETLAYESTSKIQKKDALKKQIEEPEKGQLTTSMTKKDPEKIKEEQDALEKEVPELTEKTKDASRAFYDAVKVLQGADNPDNQIKTVLVPAIEKLLTGYVEYFKGVSSI